LVKYLKRVMYLTSMGNLSDKDLIILDELQKNCRASFKEIAKKTKVPLSTVYSKIEKFEKEGYIDGYHAKLNKKKLGMHATAFGMIAYEKAEGKEFLTQRTMAEEIAKIPDVQEVYIVAGDWDIIVKICSEHIDNIANDIVDKIRLVSGVSRSLTYVCFEEVKDTDNLPLKK